MNALWPLIFSAYWTNFDGPNNRLIDQNFGGIDPELFPSENMMMLKQLPPPFASYFLRPWAEFYKESGFLSINDGINRNRDSYQVGLDVRQFKPEEVTVKVVGNYVVVEANHEEKPDEYGYIARRFVRKYKLPDQFDINKLTSRIGPDGILRIVAPLKEGSNRDTKIDVDHITKPTVKPKEREDKEVTTTTTTLPFDENDQTTVVPIK